MSEVLASTKLTYTQVEQVFSVIGQYAQRKMPIKECLTVLSINKQVRNHYETYREALNKLYKDLGKERPKAKGTFDIPDETREEFNDQVRILQKTEVEIFADKIVVAETMIEPMVLIALEPLLDMKALANLAEKGIAKKVAGKDGNT